MEPLNVTGGLGLIIFEQCTARPVRTERWKVTLSWKLGSCVAPRPVNSYHAHVRHSDLTVPTLNIVSYEAES